MLSENGDNVYTGMQTIRYDGHVGLVRWGLLCRPLVTLTQ